VRLALTAHNRGAASPRLSVEQLDRLQEDKVFDPGPAVEDLGWTSRPFVDGIAQLVDGLREGVPDANDA